MLEEHLGYVTDSVRLARFKAAIAQSVRPGDRLVDVGCGSGILGLLCLQAGADFSYAIESGPLIEVARETLRRVGLAEKSTLILGHSQQIELPERVDVAICDHVGYFGFDYGIVELMADARRRFLKPGGVVIPAQIQLWLGAVESGPAWDLAQAWRAAGVPSEFHWLAQHGVHTKHAINLKPQELLGAPGLLGQIDLRVDNPDFFSWNVELTLARDGLMQGVSGWFDCELAEGVRMTNSPLAHDAIKRSQVFLPIGEPVPVRAGEKVQVKVMARPADALIAWEVVFAASGRKFSHSTWQSQMLSPAALTKRDPAHVPQPNRHGRARVAVLNLCDGQRTIQQIEEAVLRDHADMFPSAEESVRFIAQVLSRDAE